LTEIHHKSFLIETKRLFAHLSKKPCCFLPFRAEMVRKHI